MKRIMVVWVLLTILSIVVTSAELPFIKKDSIVLEPSTELDVALKEKNITNLTIIGVQIDNGIYYKFQGDINEKLIPIPTKIKTRYYERDITEAEKTLIINRARDKRLEKLIDKTPKEEIIVEEIPIEIKQAKI